MMDTAQSGLEVREYEMNDGHELFGNLWIAPLSDGGVEIVASGQASVADPVIGNDSCARCHGALDKAAERFGTAVWNLRQSHAAGIAPVLPLAEAAVRTFALANFDGTGHEHHVMNATSFTACTATHLGFIGFNDLFGLAADSILIGTNHTDAQLVKDLEGSLVARQSELSLELHGRHARRLAGDQIRRPEPDREGRVRALHDGADSEMDFSSACPATQNTKAGAISIGITSRSTVRTDEAAAPPCALKVCSARRLIRKQALELWQRARKRQIISLKHVNNHGCSNRRQTLNIYR